MSGPLRKWCWGLYPVFARPLESLPGEVEVRGGKCAVIDNFTRY
jgi:hypothetical protein